MSKMLFAILLFVSTCAFIMQGVLVYEVKSGMNLIAEEETPDSNGAAKDIKQENSDKFFSASTSNGATASVLPLGLSAYDDLRYLKGHLHIPYMPPEVI